LPHMCPLRGCADLIVVRSDPKRPLVLGRDSHDRRFRSVSAIGGIGPADAAPHMRWRRLLRLPSLGFNQFRGPLQPSSAYRKFPYQGGGGGGRKSPARPLNAPTSRAGANDCQTIAIYEYTLYRRRSACTVALAAALLSWPEHSARSNAARNFSSMSSRCSRVHPPLCSSPGCGVPRRLPLPPWLHNR
jgi:hypothetical protein